MAAPAGLPGMPRYDRDTDEPEELSMCSNAGCHRYVSASSFCSDECRNAALGEVYDTAADDSWDGETSEVPEPFTWEKAIAVMKGGAK